MPDNVIIRGIAVVVIFFVVAVLFAILFDTSNPFRDGMWTAVGGLVGYLVAIRVQRWRRATAKQSPRAD